MKTDFIKVTKGITQIIEIWEPKLTSLEKEVITERRNKQNRNIMQILGHLVDSASNNHQRMPSPKIIAQSFSEIKPKLISCVPLIVEKIIKKNILPRFDNRVNKILLQVPIVNEKLKASIRQEAMDAFGGNFDEIIIGGAPLNGGIESLLRTINFPYTIAYGMTECAPIIASSHWSDLKQKCCGKAASRMEVAVVSENPESTPGELICKGENMMLGYYKNEEATKGVIDENGWLHTGDMAVMDKEGNISIKGRCKNLLMNASGQNIYPEEIESVLNNMVQEWYSGAYRLFNECAIIYKEKGTIEVRRPDRVMMNDDEVVVVDFKFGKKNKKYNEQVKGYISLLAEMGYKNIIGYLWYVYDGELEKVG